MHNLRAISANDKMHDLGAGLLIFCPNLLTHEKIQMIDVNYEIAFVSAALHHCKGRRIPSRTDLLHVSQEARRVSGYP